MALQETVNSCDHFRTEIHFLNRRLSCLFRPEALGYVYIYIYIRYFVVRSFDWRDIFDCFAIGLI